MENPVSVLGMTVVVIGLIIEFVAFAGMASYQVRRALRVASPIRLQSTGCATFCVGVVVLLAGQFIA